MSQHYSDKARENEATALPDLEVFYISGCEDYKHTCPHCQDETGCANYTNHDETHYGYYWQACFPGCLPDGDANGPFETEEAALADARQS